MKQEIFRQELKNLNPDVPEVFHQRVEAFLQEKVDQAVNMKDSTKRVLYTGGRFSSRALVFALIGVLALCTVAYAATKWDIFDSLSGILGTQPPTADSVMQGNLHRETVNDVEITIKEAGYDGKTLFLQYSYRLPDVAEPIGIPGRHGERMLSDEDLALLDEYNVGWWVDAFWVNGQPMDMAHNSGSNECGSEVPGEIIRTDYWRLDNIDVALTGEVEIALPIGDRQSAEYRNAIFDQEHGQYLLPDKGVVAFTFDAGDILSCMTKKHPNIATVTPDVTASVIEVVCSPLMTYITLTMEPNPDALAAYKAAHGDGFFDEEGNLLWPYTGMDVYGAWLSDLELVDGDGQRIFEQAPGMSYTSTWAEFTYPYMDAENLPEQLWLAPVNGDEADMTYAVRVK